MSEPRTAAMKIKPPNSVALSLITPEPEEKGYTEPASRAHNIRRNAR